MPVYRIPVTITATVAGRCNNTWHLRTGAIPGDEPASLAAGVAAIKQWYTDLKDEFPNGTTNFADVAINVEDGTDRAIAWTGATNSNHTPVGTIAPHLAVCTSWLTSSRTRRGRGRTFFGPIAFDRAESDGTPVAALLTAIRAANDKLVAASLVDNGWAVCIWGLENPAPKGFEGDYSTLPHVARDIVASKVGDRFAVMRSRRP